MRDIDRIAAMFDRDAMQRVCTMPETAFGSMYEGMTRHTVKQPAPDDFYFYRDHGSNILAVAHLDTVGAAHQRDCHFLNTADGEVVYSRALDDRLGAYIILELLPALGIQHDILLTVGEESGRSTAAGFREPRGKEYDWIIEFDRGGTDVVMYQYDDDLTRERVRRSGARVGEGSFSDIAYLEHLGVKAFNWGVGYRDYHGPRAHAFLDDTFSMVAKYLTFYDQNKGTFLPHDESDEPNWWEYDQLDAADEAAWDEYNAERFDADGYYEYPTPEQLRRAAELWTP